MTTIDSARLTELLARERSIHAQRKPGESCAVMTAPTTLRRVPMT